MPRFTHNDADLYYELDGSGPPAVYMMGYSGHSNGAIDTARCPCDGYFDGRHRRNDAGTAPS
jgi:hypothetical protein